MCQPCPGIPGACDDESVSKRQTSICCEGVSFALQEGARFGFWGVSTIRAAFLQCAEYCRAGRTPVFDDPAASNPSHKMVPFQERQL